MWFDRATFMQLAEGLVMKRNRRGECIVVDHLEKDFERAQRLLDKGGCVFLTMGGKTVSEMRKVDGAYVERLCVGP